MLLRYLTYLQIQIKKGYSISFWSFFYCWSISFLRMGGKWLFSRKSNQYVKTEQVEKLTMKLEDQENETLFLKVKSWDNALVGEDVCIHKGLSFVGGSRDPDAPSLFRVGNVDTGEIKHVQVAEVKQIVFNSEEEVQKRMK